jgi:predicted PurR-regulated permease PerM
MTDDEDGVAHVERGRYREDRRLFALWAIIGVFIGSVLLVATVDVFASILVGIFLYYGTRPIFRSLRQRDVPGSIAAALSLLSVGLPVLLITLIVLVMSFGQALALINSGSLTELQPLVENLDLPQTIEIGEYESLRDFIGSDSFRQVIRESWATISSFTNTMMGFLFTVLMAVTFAFFLFGWGPKAREEILDLVGDESTLSSYFTRLDRDLSSLFFGNMLNALATGIIGAIAYTTLNIFVPPEIQIPAPVLLGFLTGIASFVPLIGSKIVYVPITAILLFRSFTAGVGMGYLFAVAFFLVALIVVDTLPDLVLRPLISGRSTNQGALFVSYLVGPAVFGPVGIFLLPMAVLAFINFRKIVLPGFKKR